MPLSRNLVAFQENFSGSSIITIADSKPLNQFEIQTFLHSKPPGALYAINDLIQCVPKGVNPDCACRISSGLSISTIVSDLHLIAGGIALCCTRAPPRGDAGCPVPHNAPSPLAADARASRHWTVASRGASIPDAFALVLWRSAGDSLTMPLTIMVAGFQAHCEVRSEFPAVPPSFRVCLHRLPSSLITLLDLAERFCHICCT